MQISIQQLTELHNEVVQRHYHVDLKTHQQLPLQTAGAWKHFKRLKMVASSMSPFSPLLYDKYSISWNDNVQYDVFIRALSIIWHSQNAAYFSLTPSLHLACNVSAGPVYCLYLNLHAASVQRQVTIMWFWFSYRFMGTVAFINTQCMHIVMTYLLYQTFKA